ncbi:adenine phosphoribosyltransferase [bacterium]|nr:MAG: adenine phosphoribosyltransferase [bacterium]RKZ21430.1 MAG: adenine phosphoribosyltransferase [bacterium]
MDLKKYIRDVPDFPKEGIIFKDITTLIGNGDAFKYAVDKMIEPFKEESIDRIIGIESRGFLFGGAMAYIIGTGVNIARKPGKLPWKTIKEEYSLEYGTNALEIHIDAVKEGEKILIVDDLLATGGTALAVAKLVERLGGSVVGISFLVELTFLNGRKKLEGYKVHSVIEY